MIDLTQLIDQCVNPKHKTVMQAIVKVESGGKPLAIGLNKGFKLQYQAKDTAQAKSWVDYLEKNNYNFDVGIGQVNIKNIHNYGYKASDLLDPCLNLKIASEIFDKSHQSALATDNSANALKKAISAYNTGNFRSGFKNGYVAKVTAKMDIKLAVNNNIPPIVSTASVNNTQPSNKVKVSVVNNASTNDTTNPYTSKSVLYVAPPKKSTKEDYENAIIKK